MHIKRGDTFSLMGVMPTDWPVGDWTVRAAFCDKKRYYHTVEASLTETPEGKVLSLFASPAVTRQWSVGPGRFDVEFTNSSITPAFVISSSTMNIEVIEDITL